MREKGIPYSLEGYEYIGSFPFVITCPQCKPNASVTVTYLKDPQIRCVYTRPNWPRAHASCTFVWVPL